MHDVGKLGIPDHLLLKPGKLTVDERLEIEKHTLIGGKILENPSSNILKRARVIALTHHENWNGTGYPNRLRENDIPVEGRIVAIADVLDALVSKRCYKTALTLDEAMMIIRDEAGKKFDPTLVPILFDNYEKVLQIYLFHHSGSVT